MRIYFLLFLLCSGCFAFSQQRVSEKIKANFNDSTPRIELFSISPNTSFRPRFLQSNADYLELNLDADKLQNIIAEKPKSLLLQIPSPKGFINLRLLRNDNKRPFPVYTSNHGNKKQANINYVSLHYRGIIESKRESLVSFSILNNQVRMVLGTENGNINIGKIKHSNRYAYVPTKGANLPRGGCDTELLPRRPSIAKNKKNEGSNLKADGCVEIYFELDHQTFLDNGSSVENTTAFMEGLFNEVATLYENEGVQVAISEIFIWTEPDIYNHGSTSLATLSQFQDQIVMNDFNGDLAHLVSSVQNGRGGIAWLNVLCTNIRQFASAFSEITGSYNNVPTYSWDVEVITHELGHNIGSPHTHQCEWNGNNTQIDDCGNEAVPGYAGDCYDESNPIFPAEGGTIMSYCHLFGGVGINFSNGFGQQPGDLIRERVASAECITACCEFTGEVDLGEDIFTCEETITLDAGVTGFTYEWNTGETTQTIEVSESGTYTVTISNECGSTSDEIEVEFGEEPELDLPEEYQYCDTPVTVDATTEDAITYLWSTGETTESISISTPGDYWVDVTNQCGTSRYEFTVVQIGPVSFNLGDDREICEGEDVTLTIPVGGTYLWSTGETTQSITVFETGEYWGRVTTNCGTSEDNITINVLQNPEVSVTGNLSICEGDVATVTADVQYASNIEWSTGETTETIEITQAGDYWLRATNECATVTHNFSIDVESLPNAMLGPDAEICEGESFELQLPGNAISYAWNTGETTQSITVSEAGEYWGQITTNCGTSQDEIVITQVQSPTITLSGDLEICEDGSTVLSVSQTFGDNILWSTGETTNTITISETGPFWVRVSNECFTSQKDFNVSLQDEITIPIEDYYVLCSGEQLVLDAGNEGATFEWQDRSTEQTYTVTKAGTYHVKVTEGNCSSEKTTTVEILQPISLNIGNDKKACLREQIQLQVDVEQGQSVVWSDGSTSNVFIANETGTYSVQLSNICETVADVIYIEFYDCCIAQVPTGFSPDNNGINDVFQPLFNCKISDYAFKVYNRLGNTVFETSEKLNGWNGQFNNQLAPPDAYLWTLTYFDEENNQTRTYKGVVNLIR